MSYPRDIDDYDATELIAELRKRRQAQIRGRCDYCGKAVKRDGIANRCCKYPGRHHPDNLLPRSVLL